MVLYVKGKEPVRTVQPGVWNLQTIVSSCGTCTIKNVNYLIMGEIEEERVNLLCNSAQRIREQRNYIEA